MLRRPLTTLTLTSEDIKAYEDRQQTVAFSKLVAPQRNASLQPTETHSENHNDDHSNHSSDYEEYDSDDDEDQEPSYLPSRYQQQQQQQQQQQRQPQQQLDDEDDDDGNEIYRNEVDRSPIDIDEMMEIDEDERTPATGLNPPAPRTGPPVNRFGHAGAVARAARQRLQQQLEGGGRTVEATPDAPGRMMTRSRDERIGIGRTGGARGI